MTKRTHLILSLALVTAAIALSACSSSSGDPDTGLVRDGDAGRDGGPREELTYLPREQCSATCTAVPADLYFPDHQGPSACYDGCNACLCTTEGLTFCTARACAPEDDLGVDQGPDQGP